MGVDRGSVLVVGKTTKEIRSAVVPAAVMAAIWFDHREMKRKVVAIVVVVATATTAKVTTSM